MSINIKLKTMNRGVTFDRERNAWGGYDLVLAFQGGRIVVDHHTAIALASFADQYIRGER